MDSYLITTNPEWLGFVACSSINLLKCSKSLSPPSNLIGLFFLSLGWSLVTSLAVASIFAMTRFFSFLYFLPKIGVLGVLSYVQLPQNKISSREIPFQ
uniref:Uncharacterized protein n=1 Tax=Nothoprocta perdicaria TaxID=30464 RepID=A0A8C7A1R8_NOTPE